MVDPRIPLALVLLAPFASCSDTASDVPGDRSVEVRFSALAAGAPFGCSTELEIGAAKTPATVRDLRFFVAHPALVTASGTEVPLTLESDGAWQSETLALLDFEAACETTGTSGTNSVIRGTVPAGDYVGLVFELGVPFELNHLNDAEADAPLNIAGMFWGWQAGYKFMRLELDLGGNKGWFFHVGSIGCESDSSVRPPESCTRPNRARVALSNFDPDSQVVAFDLDALFDGFDIGTNTDKTPAGCMSELAEEGECSTPFGHIGIDWKTGESLTAAPAFRAVNE